MDLSFDINIDVKLIEEINSSNYIVFVFSSLTDYSKYECPHTVYITLNLYTMTTCLVT